MTDWSFELLRKWVKAEIEAVRTEVLYSGANSREVKEAERAFKALVEGVEDQP